MTESRPARAAPPPVSPEQKKLMMIQMVYMIISFGMLFVISNQTLRTDIGTTVNVLLYPVIGFNGLYPLMTIVSSGVIIGLLTSIPRYFFTDWIKMGKIQQKMRAYNQAFREAYRKNQRDRVQKLSKMRSSMMMENQQVSMNTMKPLMVMTIFTLTIFIWLFYLVDSMPYQLIAAPWGNDINIATSSVAIVPSWIVLYTFSSLTVGYLVTMIIKYFDFDYKIREREKTDSEFQVNE
ncbi:MAG: EMC3/TMCO1 family protein [Candidatus Thermoplasmatota archaeon]|nr:EMC3/TMCO1 family protein [Candidatus Thermoplasmatota archaeon]